MNPRMKAYLLGLGLLVLATGFGIRALWKYQSRDSIVGAVLSGVVACGFLYGGVHYLFTGRSDSPKESKPTGEPPSGGAS